MHLQDGKGVWGTDMFSRFHTSHPCGEAPRLWGES